MSYKKILKLFICFVPIITIINCSSPSEPNPDNLMSLIEPPTITGFYVTTNHFPDGTGEIIGSPAYTIKYYNVFPNPVYELKTSEIIRNRNQVHFIRLPVKATIIIVRGKNQLENSSSVSSAITGTQIRNGVEIVRTLEKNDSSFFVKWDLKDKNGIYVLPGYYRAYIYSSQVLENYWLDLAIIDTIRNQWERF